MDVGIKKIGSPLRPFQESLHTKLNVSHLMWDQNREMKYPNRLIQSFFNLPDPGCSALCLANEYYIQDTEEASFHHHCNYKPCDYEWRRSMHLLSLFVGMNVYNNCINIHLHLSFFFLIYFRTIGFFNETLDCFAPRYRIISHTYSGKMICKYV